jgi:D-xylose transport system substrate-binding protein
VASGRRKKAALLLQSYTQLRWKVADQAFFEKQAALEGFDVIVQQANDSVTTQDSQLDNVLTQGIDCLVLVAVNTDAGEAMVKKSLAAGVPVVCHNSIINNVELAAFVGRSTAEVGTYIGQYALKTAPKGNYALIKGDQGNSIAQGKAKGLMAVLQPHIDSGDIKIVADQWIAGWDGALAQKAAENALTANANNIQAMCSLGDGMSYGVIEALRAQGLAGKVYVSGEDAEPAACKLIKQGTFTMSVFTPFSELGTLSAKAAGQILRGEKVTASTTYNNGWGEVPWLSAPTRPITKDNVLALAQEFPWWVSAKDLQ